MNGFSELTLVITIQTETDHGNISSAGRVQNHTLILHPGHFELIGWKN